MAYEDDRGCSLHMPFLLLFFCIFPILLSVKTWRCGRSLLTSSASFSKLISCCFHRPVFDLGNHLYGMPYVFRRKSTEFPSSCSWPLSLKASNAAFEYRSFIIRFYVLFLHPAFIQPAPSAQWTEELYPAMHYLACPENFSTLPVCVQKIGLLYSIRIYTTWNYRKRPGHLKTLVFMGGHHEGVGIHDILHRVSIIGTVVKSPVEEHGGHISDCA